MEFFVKMVKNYNYFSKALHPRSLTGFWICLSLINFYSDPALCIIWYIFRTLFIIVNSDIFNHIHALFRHIQPYCGIFRTLCNSCIFKTLSYSKSWHIYNPRCIQNSFKTYFDIFKTLCNTRILRPLLYSERCPIQNFGIFRTRGIFKILFIYPHSGIFRHIQ